jgi:hypothetical protein
MIGLHPVAEKVGTVDHNVADMHADAEAHRLAPGGARLFDRDRVLHRDRAGNSVNRAGEIGDYAVAGGVEDPAAMGCDQPVHDDTTGLEPGERPDFISRLKPAMSAAKIAASFRSTG